MNIWLSPALIKEINSGTIVAKRCQLNFVLGRAGAAADHPESQDRGDGVSQGERPYISV